MGAQGRRHELLMMIMGRSTETMARHYGQSAAERAKETQLRLGVG
jgi:hypothetical protein